MTAFSARPVVGKIYSSKSQQNVAVAIAVVFFLNKLYDCVFIVGEIALYIYKGTFLPYEASDIGLEAVLLALLLILDVLRFAFGAKGYLTQRLGSLSLCLLLTPAVLLIGIHAMIWQTYVTRIDYILGAILISFHVAEFFLLLVASLMCMMRSSSFDTR